jgi:hypothetical protein
MSVGVLLLLPAIAVAQFPSALSGPIAVTSATYGAAPEAQFGPMMTGTSEMGLLVWRDSRRGAYSVLASRVSSDGAVLDVLGILVADGAFPEAVITDRAVFRILLFEHDGRHVVTIDRNGVLVSDRTLDASLSRGQCAASRSAPSARFLLWTTSDAGTSASILDGAGDVVAQHVLFSTAYNGSVIGASRDRDFLLMIPFSTFDAPTDYLALRVSDDAQLISSAVAGIPGFGSADLLAGGDDGYLLVRQPDYAHPTAINTYKLDEKGVFGGATAIFDDPDPNDRRPKNAGHVEWAGDRYVMTVSTGAQVGHSLTEYGELKSDKWETRVLSDWVGLARDTTGATIGNRFFVVASVNQLFTSSNYDLYLQPEDRTDARLVTGSAALQTNARVAAGKNGYLLAWSENGPDRFARSLVRRFSATGEPQGGPIVIREVEQSFSYPTLSTDLRLASNGETYVVLYWKDGAICVRRMKAETGEWLDADPIQIASGGQAEVASNGRDAVVVFSTNDGMSARRIALAGDALPAPPVPLGSTQNAYNPAIASDGEDYLVAWSDGFRACLFECTYDRFKLLGVRLRADATRIDATPIVLDNAGYADMPSIAFGGGRYLVTWNDLVLRALRVTREGTVSESSTIDDSTDIRWPSIVFAVKDRFVLLTKHVIQRDVFESQNWAAVTFEDSLALDRVGGLPRTILTSGQGTSYLSMAAAVRDDDVVALAYDETAEVGKGHVNRAFLQFFGYRPKRRATAH